MRQRLLYAFATCLGLALPAGGAQAVTVTLEAPATVEVGGVVEVDVRIAGTTAFAAPSVRSFDLDIAFDPNVLELLEVVFDGYLGTPGTQALVDSGEPVEGSADLAAVSLLSAATLHALQPDGFRLATLRFEALAAGATSLDFTQTVVADTAGGALVVDAAAGAELIVTPEPGTAALLAAGLALAAAGRRRRRAS